MSEVISEEQRLLNKNLHKSNSDFGKRATDAGTAFHLPAALNRMNEFGICQR